MNPLQDFELNEINNGELPGNRPQFEITDMNSLNWAFRKIAALKSQEKEIKALATTEKQRIEEWERQELKPLADSLSFFENLVSVYHTKHCRKTRRQKHFPHLMGNLKAGQQKQHLKKWTRKTSAACEGCRYGRVYKRVCGMG